MADNPRIDDLRRRLDREPGSRVFAQLAEELRKAGQLPEAIRVARQGLLVHSGYPSARMTLGRALMDLRDLRGARAEFEAVLRGATDNILASRFLGECLEGLGDLGSALLQFRATLRLAPGDRNLEAQIRALEEKLTPSSAGGAAVAPAPRPAPLPRGGAIPVLEVDGPMELESSFEEPTPWRATPPPSVVAMGPPPLMSSSSVQELSAASDPLAPEGGIAFPDDSPPMPVDGEPDAAGSLEMAGAPLENTVARGSEAPAADVLEATLPPGPELLDESMPFGGEGSEAGTRAASGASSEPPALSSSTLAELYFNQGFTGQAIDVYRELLEREPGNERIAARIMELEAIARELDREPLVATAPPADPKMLRRAAIERTITRLEGFLAAVRRA